MQLEGWRDGCWRPIPIGILLDNTAPPYAEICFQANFLHDLLVAVSVNPGATL